MAVRRVRDIDWTSWRAVDPATLVFIVKDDRVLLIRKKRGLGAGKVNGPGGRLEPGETFKACAIREVQEELRVTPVDPIRVGQHAFQFVDGYSILVHVYRASGLVGNPQETEEATPFGTISTRFPTKRCGKMIATGSLLSLANNNLLGGGFLKGILCLITN